MRRFVSTRLVAVMALLAAAATALGTAADGDGHSGVARIVDGDTLVLDGDRRIRLFGIDAPEAGQACGRADGTPYDCGAVATARLADLAEGRTIVCEERDRDRYGRIVGICRVGGRDLNAVLVSEGLAFAYRDYSTLYVPEERTARLARRGVFAGTASPPWEHRAAQRVDTAQAGPNGCTIKGNVGRSGRRLYHTPASPSFAATRIDPRRGERWFCSEAEARAAGFARAHP